MHVPAVNIIIIDGLPNMTFDLDMYYIIHVHVACFDVRDLNYLPFW